ncbi:MAG: T9SS type A sorting domain-containing protein [Flavobacteriales bacterium]|nr:T9SS type A sorting domain-containing protein [Flavobacteriales bacterium]
MTIHNALGSLMRTTTLSANGSVDVSDLATGSYVLRVVDDDEVGVLRFVKE